MVALGTHTMAIEDDRVGDRLIHLLIGTNAASPSPSKDSAALKCGGNLVENIRNAIGKWSGGSEFVLEIKDVTKSDIELVEAAFEETGVRGRATINFEDCKYILTMGDACMSPEICGFIPIYLQRAGYNELEGLC